MSIELANEVAMAYGVYIRGRDRMGIFQNGNLRIILLSSQYSVIREMLPPHLKSPWHWQVGSLKGLKLPRKRRGYIISAVEAVKGALLLFTEKPTLCKHRELLGRVPVRFYSLWYDKK